MDVHITIRDIIKKLYSVIKNPSNSRDAMHPIGLTCTSVITNAHSTSFIHFHILTTVRMNGASSISNDNVKTLWSTFYNILEIKALLCTFKTITATMQNKQMKTKHGSLF